MSNVIFSGSFTDRLPCGGDLFINGDINGVVCDQTAKIHSDDTLTVCFWGTIYNHPDIQKGSVARNIGDMYLRVGVKAFGQLDGSFVIIIRDANKTIIVRDHHGTHGQVYYSSTYFASSLSELLRLEEHRLKPDYGSLCSFLSVGYIPTGSSSFEGVSKLGAGMALVVEGCSQRTINLFDASSILPVSGVFDLEELSRNYGELHRSAIKSRVRESRNVGILLSGGYDSGCNLAALRKIYDGDIRSFSIGFKGDAWSELPLAQCMSDTFGTIHTQYEIDGSEILSLPSIIDHLGDPFVEGGLMVNYAAMRLIGDPKPDIILGGDGSDQYFGTSGREVAMHYLASRYGVKPFLRMLYNFLGQDRFETNGKPYRMRFHMSKILNILQGDMFGFEPFVLEKLLLDKSAITSAKHEKTDCRSFEHLYIQHKYKSDIERIINQVILFKASRMAEMFDNRIAFPYMDLELYKFLQSIPVAYQCKGDSAMSIAKGHATAKFLLKYHYKPMLPDAITSKKKQGGFAPMPIFFKDKIQRGRIADFVMNSTVTSEFLNCGAVERFINTYDYQADGDGWFWYKQNKAIQYFNLLTLAIWWERYVKGKQSISL